MQPGMPTRTPSWPTTGRSINHHLNHLMRNQKTGYLKVLLVEASFWQKCSFEGTDLPAIVLPVLYVTESSLVVNPPVTGNIYVIEDHANGDVFACLPDGADRDIISQGSNNSRAACAALFLSN